MYVYNVGVDYIRMTCDFTSCSAVFQSYQNNGRIVMKGYNGFPFTVEMISDSSVNPPDQQAGV